MCSMCRVSLRCLRNGLRWKRCEIIVMAIVEDLWDSERALHLFLLAAQFNVSLFNDVRLRRKPRAHTW
jgi:hypothetical protein